MVLGGVRQALAASFLARHHGLADRILHHGRLADLFEAFVETQMRTLAVGLGVIRAVDRARHLVERILLRIGVRKMERVLHPLGKSRRLRLKPLVDDPIEGVPPSSEVLAALRASALVVSPPTSMSLTGVPSARLINEFFQGEAAIAGSNIGVDRSRDPTAGFCRRIAKPSPQIPNRGCDLGVDQPADGG